MGFPLVMMEDHSGMKILKDGYDTLVKGVGRLQRERSLSHMIFSIPSYVLKVIKII